MEDARQMRRGDVMTPSPTRPILSLILCSRNDAYMGDSRWRLKAALNYLSLQVEATGRANDVEVLVADWGSEHPLCDSLGLDPAAARLVSFITVPPAVAHAGEPDRPFAAARALNAAARRARGTYIGRIDQDTLVGARFLRTFFSWVDAGAPFGTPLETAVCISNRRRIPYRIAVRCPSFRLIARLVRVAGPWLSVDETPAGRGRNIGIWLMHRDTWDAAGGYDERLIYRHGIEADMAARLASRHAIIDVGELVKHDFYHLDHHHPRFFRPPPKHQRMSTQPVREWRGFRPSGDGWGLPEVSFEISVAKWLSRASGRPRAAIIEVPQLMATVAWTSLQGVVDRVMYGPPPDRRRWWSRALRKLWAGRVSAKVESS